MAKKKSSSKKKEKQQKVSPISAWRVLAGIFCFAVATIGCAYSYKPAGKLSLGIGGALVFSILVAVGIRLCSRKSRLSITYTSLICISGLFILDTWSYVTSVLVRGSHSIYWCGDPGLIAGKWLEGFCSDQKWQLLLTTASVFIWVTLATMRLWTSLARYIINKPYIREIVIETTPKPEKATMPKPAVATEPTKKPSRVVRPEDDLPEGPRPSKDNKPKKPVQRVFGEDELPKYQMPSPSLLQSHSDKVHEVSKEEITRDSSIIRETLADHKVQITDIKAIPGPTVTLYKVYPDRGVSVSSIMGKQNDLAVALNVDGVRGEILKDSVGIEVPNDHRSMVPIKDLVSSDEFTGSDAELPIAIGCTVDRRVKVFDLARTPHLLVAGATQQGKSVGLNVMIASLLFAKHPSELQFVFVDPKGNEFDSYKHLYRHYLAVLPGSEGEADEVENSICVKPKQAETALRSLCLEMTERYDLMRSAGSTPNIKTYNDKFKAHKLNPKNGHRLLPYIVAVIDEYADLTMSGSFSPEGRAIGRNIMTSLILLASKGRAAGIHLIIATQTPRKDVISGVIKANFPTQIAFKVANNTDSRVILDNPGAEKLLGNGDMIFAQNARLERIQCGYIGPDEITALARAIESQDGFQKSFTTPYYLPEVKDEEDGTDSGPVDMKKIDARFEEAARLVVETQKASTSYLQTTLGMGFAKSARVMSQLEAAGIVGHADGAKPREVLVQDLAELEPILKAYTSH